MALNNTGHCIEYSVGETIPLDNALGSMVTCETGRPCPAAVGETRTCTTLPAATYEGTKKRNTTTSILTLPMPYSSNLFVKSLCQLMRRMRSAWLTYAS